MNEVERQRFSIKCECLIMKNNIPLNTKRKSKFSVIELDSTSNTLNIIPYGLSKQQSKPMTFSLNKLRTIHKKYIDQGKMTLEFFEKSEKIVVKGIDVSATDQTVETFTTILVSSASKQNLELMISKIVESKKKQSKDSKKKIAPTQPITSKPPQSSKKKIKVDTEEHEEHFQKMNRKDLRDLLTNPIKKQKKAPKAFEFDFLELPYSIREQIFGYCRLSLEHRLINKKFSKFILESIHSIKLKDEVDEISFNKLAMWAVNIKCRMKNVRKINLKDRYDDEELVFNRAKSLRFGDWKQITSRNILEIKGLKTFCIELPYSIKFDLSHLFGQRMVQLRFKGASFTKNDCIKVEDLAHILKHTKELKVLELPFCTSNLFPSIEFPKRLEELRIYYVSDNGLNKNWNDLSRFQNLKIFSCCSLEVLGVKKQNFQVDIQFPLKLKELEIGSFLSTNSFEKLPFELQYLQLVGNFTSSHLETIVLPFMKELDISQSPSIRPEIIEFVKDITLMTSWDRSTLDYMMKYAQDRNINLLSTRS